MIGSTKGNPAASIYVRGPVPVAQDPTSLVSFMARELAKIEAATRRLDERLKAGSL